MVERDRWLGPRSRFFAGNVIPLFARVELVDARRSKRRWPSWCRRPLRRNAWRSEVGTHVGAREASARQTPPRMCQHCHGAPGMVTTFADAPFASPELDALLLDGRSVQLGRRAADQGLEPLPRHGWERLRIPQALPPHQRPDLARPAHANSPRRPSSSIAALSSSLAADGISLWTGDVGLAIYLWDCITGEASFPDDRRVSEADTTPARREGRGGFAHRQHWSAYLKFATSSRRRQGDKPQRHLVNINADPGFCPAMHLE